MRRILEDLYHGSLTVSGQTFRRGTKYARALARLAETEDALGRKLAPEDHPLLAEYAMASAGLTSVSLEEAYIESFRTGARIMLAVLQAIEQAKQEGVPKWGGKIPPNLKLPLRDGDVDRPEDPAYADSYFINATSQEQPGVVDRKRVKITDPLAIYSGCYIRASINIYPFNANGNRGIAAGLSNIQFWEDGEPLNGRVRAEDEFDALDDDDADDFLD